MANTSVVMNLNDEFDDAVSRKTNLSTTLSSLGESPASLKRREELERWKANKNKQQQQQKATTKSVRRDPPVAPRTLSPKATKDDKSEPNKTEPQTTKLDPPKSEQSTEPAFVPEDSPSRKKQLEAWRAKRRAEESSPRAHADTETDADAAPYHESDFFQDAPSGRLHKSHRRNGVLSYTFASARRDKVLTPRPDLVTCPCAICARRSPYVSPYVGDGEAPPPQTRSLTRPTCSSAQRRARTIKRFSFDHVRKPARSKTAEEDSPTDGGVCVLIPDLSHRFELGVGTQPKGKGSDPKNKPKRRIQRKINRTRASPVTPSPNRENKGPATLTKEASSLLKSVNELAARRQVHFKDDGKTNTAESRGALKSLPLNTELKDHVTKPAYDIITKKNRKKKKAKSKSNSKNKQTSDGKGEKESDDNKSLQDYLSESFDGLTLDKKSAADGDSENGNKKDVSVKDDSNHVESGDGDDNGLGNKITTYLDSIPQTGLSEKSVPDDANGMDNNFEDGNGSAEEGLEAKFSALTTSETSSKIEVTSTTTTNTMETDTTSVKRYVSTLVKDSGNTASTEADQGIKLESMLNVGQGINIVTAKASLRNKDSGEVEQYDFAEMDSTAAHNMVENVKKVVSSVRIDRDESDGVKITADLKREECVSTKESGVAEDTPIDGTETKEGEPESDDAGTKEGPTEVPPATPRAPPQDMPPRDGQSSPLQDYLTRSPPRDNDCDTPKFFSPQGVSPVPVVNETQDESYRLNRREFHETKETMLTESTSSTTTHHVHHFSKESEHILAEASPDSVSSENVADKHSTSDTGFSKEIQNTIAQSAPDSVSSNNIAGKHSLPNEEDDAAQSSVCTPRLHKTMQLMSGQQFPPDETIQEFVESVRRLMLRLGDQIALLHETSQDEAKKRYLASRLRQMIKMLETSLDVLSIKTFGLSESLRISEERNAALQTENEFLRRQLRAVRPTTPAGTVNKSASHRTPFFTPTDRIEFETSMGRFSELAKEYDHTVSKGNGVDTPVTHRSQLESYMKSVQSSRHSVSFHDYKQFPQVSQSLGTTFVAELCGQINLDQGQHASLANIMDRHWQRSVGVETTEEKSEMKMETKSEMKMETKSEMTSAS